VIFEALTAPHPPWLALQADEQPPETLAATPPTHLEWSSLWPRRPDARIRFDLTADGPGTLLRWTLLVDDPLPDPSLLGHLRKRLNELINADLRHTFGQ